MLEHPSDDDAIIASAIMMLSLASIVLAGPIALVLSFIALVM